MPPLTPAKEEKLPAFFDARLPPLIAETDEETQEHFLEFFVANLSPWEV